MSNVPQERSNTQIGKKGEELAAKYLEQKGIQILQFNYRFGRAEIDLIGLEKGILLFIEVKYRTNLLYGFPEEAVDRSKVKRIKTAAENYIFEKNWQQDIRFDIVSIVDKGRKVSIEHLEDCF